MFTVLECPDEFSIIDSLAKEKTQALIAKLIPVEKELIIPAGADFKQLGADSFFVLREGAIKLSLGETELLFLEQGDAFGFQAFGTLPGLELKNDFAIKASQFSCADLALVHGQVLADFISAQNSRLLVLIQSHTPADQTQLPDIRTFPSGTVIIKEGSIATEVFTLLSGSADVLVGDVKVGEVLVDEIFGGLAALSGSQRTADVIARENCMVLSLPADQFVTLIRTRPHTVTKLMEDMARTIASLNQKIIALSGGSKGTLT